MTQDLWSLHQDKLTDIRRAKMLAVANKRTDFIRLILQDVENPHNISACLRSAEAFGVGNVDIVRLTSKFKPSTVARGVDGWLSLSTYTSIEESAKAVKAQGYKIVAAMPRPDAKKLPELALDQKIAVLLGNEHKGVSPDWSKFADEAITIPMVGMVESLNISVSAAIILWELTSRAKALFGDAYYLDDRARQALLSQWMQRQLHLEQPSTPMR